MSGAGLVARLTVLGSGEEGTGPGLALTVARVAEYSGEETPLVQVTRTLFSCFSREAMDNARAFCSSAWVRARSQRRSAESQLRMVLRACVDRRFL
jgi:hypothetical protein